MERIVIHKDIDQDSPDWIVQTSNLNPEDNVIIGRYDDLYDALDAKAFAGGGRDSI